MGGRTIQDEGREALQSAFTKLRVKTPGAIEVNRHDSADPDLLGGIGIQLREGLQITLGMAGRHACGVRRRGAGVGVTVRTWQSRHCSRAMSI